MWILTIEDDEGAVSRHPLAGERCTLGRAPDRDLVLGQANVSRRHARFERRGEGWFVVDEGSDNGTFVNGVAIDGPTPVGEGDAVQLGGYRVALSLGESLRE
ncbi:MAG TPA: FHA domain-containing protein, partial [Polyangiaceae bacterium]|nr:FHA domain-containing protein [Polyangiaceae bacterium]